MLMFPFLKSVHVISLYIFLGGPIFWYFVWRPSLREAMPSETEVLYKRVRMGLVGGALLFAVSGLGEALRAGTQIVASNDFEVILFFMTSRFGRLTLLKVALTSIATLSFLLAGRKPNRFLSVVGAMSGAGLLVVTSLLSHAAGKPGIFPVVSDVIHLMASIVWSGGLFFLAILPWKSIRSKNVSVATPLAALVERFTNIALVAVVLVAATGAFAAYLHIYTPLALQKTSYGMALVAKVALFVVVLALACANYLYVAPGLRRARKKHDPGLFHKTVSRLVRYTRVEAVVLAALLVATGVLTTLPPADTFNEVKQSSWELRADEYLVTVLMYPTGSQSPGEVQFSVGVTDAEGLPVQEGTRVLIDLDMVSHAMGIPPVETVREESGRFRGTALISMAGPWRGVIRLVSPDGEAAVTSFDFQAAQGARSVGETRRFDFRAVTFSSSRLISLIAGGVWFVVALYGVVTSRRQRLPRWITPVSMLALGVSGYLVFSATLVDAYPTAYIRSPVPFESRTVEAGRELFLAHCAHCHGPEGLGDGELAAVLDTPPVDLSEEHVDDHTDGEIFWWVTNGIPVSGMPGVGSALTEQERWQLVMFVRSIRREVPESDHGE